MYSTRGAEKCALVSDCVSTCPIALISARFFACLAGWIFISAIVSLTKRRNSSVSLSNSIEPSCKGIGVLELSQASFCAAAEVQHVRNLGPPVPLFGTSAFPALQH